MIDSSRVSREVDKRIVKKLTMSHVWSNKNHCSQSHNVLVLRIIAHTHPESLRNAHVVFRPFFRNVNYGIFVKGLETSR